MFMCSVCPFVCLFVSSGSTLVNMFTFQEYRNILLMFTVVCLVCEECKNNIAFTETFKIIALYYGTCGKSFTEYFNENTLSQI